MIIATYRLTPLERFVCPWPWSIKHAVDVQIAVFRRDGVVAAVTRVDKTVGRLHGYVHGDERKDKMWMGTVKC